MDISKFSIIVPVYNVEKYLSMCIDSILASNEKDFEVLLVDDGSTDKSGAICDYYGLTDSRVRVFHKDNGGVSSARNLALTHAQGEWVAFVDADDLVDPDYLSLAKVPVDTDVVIKSTLMLSEEGQVVSSEIIHSFLIMEGNYNVAKAYVRHRHNALWNKLIRRRILGKVLFDETVRVGEDFLFFLACIPNIRKVVSSPLGCYSYFLHPASSMRSVTPNQRLDILIENISKVFSICHNQNILLGRNIIASTYVPLVAKYRRLLDNNQKEYIDRVILQYSISDLRYLSLRQHIAFGISVFKLKYL